MMPKIGVLKKNKLIKLFRFGFYTSFIFTSIFFIDINVFHPILIMVGFIFGILVGLLEEITSLRRYVNISLPLQFLLKIFEIILIVILLLVGLVIFHPEVEFENLRNFMKQKEVTSPMILSLVVAFTVITYFQVEKLIGKNMLANYLKGR